MKVAILEEELRNARVSSMIVGGESKKKNLGRVSTKPTTHLAWSTRAQKPLVATMNCKGQKKRVLLLQP